MDWSLDEFLIIAANLWRRLLPIPAAPPPCFNYLSDVYQWLTVEFVGLLFCSCIDDDILCCRRVASLIRLIRRYIRQSFDSSMAIFSTSEVLLTIHGFLVVLITSTKQVSTSLFQDDSPPLQPFTAPRLVFRRLAVNNISEIIFFNSVARNNLLLINSTTCPSTVVWTICSVFIRRRWVGLRGALQIRMLVFGIFFFFPGITTIETIALKLANTKANGLSLLLMSLLLMSLLLISLLPTSLLLACAEFNLSKDTKMTHFKSHTRRTIWNF